MSRSFRAPWYVEGYKGSGKKRFFKNYANRRLRRKDAFEVLPNGMSYKRFSEQWCICDYRWFWDPKPYVHLNWKTKELEWVYPEDRPWKVCRK